jgi:hypothetical protein
MEEEDVIQQIGLIFTQMWYTRRAMEEIERNTARYGGISFANALAAGPRFGEPPLYNGALKVHVVNINDLMPGTGIGALLEGLLGGIGRFFGGFIGGTVGGTISGALLPWMLLEMRRITDNLKTIGEVFREINAGRPDNQAASENGSGSGTDLNQLTRTLNALANLFYASSDEGDRVGGEVPEGWLTTLYVAQRLVESVSRLVDGLILLIPIFVGGFAHLLMQLDVLKYRVLDLLQFAIRNLFLLRGVVLVTIYDTLAGAAQLGAQILPIVQNTMISIANSLFDIIGEVLHVTVEALRFLGNGIKNIMDGVLEWLRTGIGTFLIDLGRTDVFRLLHHLVRVLPLILPSLVVLVHDQDKGLSSTDRDALRDAASMNLPSDQLTGGMRRHTPFPDIDTMLPQSAIDAFTDSVDGARSAITSSTTAAFQSVEQGLQRMQGHIRRSATSAQGLFADANDSRVRRLRQQAGALAEALTPALDAARREADRTDRPATGLEAIANAYEQWLVGGGFDAVLERLTDHFERAPRSGTEAERSLIGRIVAASAGVAEPQTATVRIERVVIEVEPPQAAAGEDEESNNVSALEGRFLAPDFVERLHARLAVHEREWELRGGDPRYSGLDPSVSG